MKKIFTLTVFSLMALLSFADDNRNDGKLSITNLSNQDVRVEVDGWLFNDYNNVVTIPELAPGYHTVKVYRNKRNGNRVNGRKQLLYNSTVSVKPRTEMQIIINRGGQISVTEKPLFNSRNGRGRDYDNDRPGRGNDRDGRDGRWDDRYNGPMSDQSFFSLRESLQRERFESTRFEMAKQLIGRNFFTTAQVKQIAQLFSFENNKLELAKLAYGKTTDRQYYAVMYDVLAFSNSRRELATYINNFK